MSDDWQVGDRAVCIDNGCGEIGGWGAAKVLVVGKIYVVAALGISPVSGRPCMDVEGIERWDDGAGDYPNFHVARFRKIKPDTHEPCEEEFQILLKLSKKRAVA